MDELRHNFGRAMDVDAKQLHVRLDRLETDNIELRRHNQQLQQAVDLLRHIASDHERQLQTLTRRRTTDEAGGDRRDKETSWTSG